MGARVARLLLQRRREKSVPQSPHRRGEAFLAFVDQGLDRRWPDRSGQALDESFDLALRERAGKAIDRLAVAKA